jgi:tRNA modification GTPase
MSRPDSSTTIAAIASPPGPGARGIVRISGPLARTIVDATWAGASPVDLARRGAFLGRFRDGRGEQPLLLLWMPGPRSYTREDVAEFHLPGSPPLLHLALARTLELGAVAAAPGEFTRRAFLSGRLDLTRAEGVLALVSARNEDERRAGRALLDGGLARRVEVLRSHLDDLRALVEASLDFDPRDTGHVPDEETTGRAREIRAALAETLGWESARVGAGGKPRIVLAGAPNAGKSALFNRLAGHDGAIVSPVAGTTRDVLSVEIDLGGVACLLFDAAGIDEQHGGDRVAREAQVAGRSLRASADLLVWVLDATPSRSPAPAPAPAPDPRGTDLLLVWNKIDRPGAPQAPPADVVVDRPWVATSAALGTGIDVLRAATARAIGARGTSGVSRELSSRHRLALERASAALDRAIAERGRGEPLEILAEDLRHASLCLDEITGATATEALLDRIFARFCLGK